jgi:hypothetical protein
LSGSTPSRPGSVLACGRPSRRSFTSTEATGYSLSYGMRLVQAMRTRCPRRTSMVEPGTWPS